MPEPEPAEARGRRSGRGDPRAARRSRVHARSATTPGERLHADGFDDAQIDAWAETFIAEVSSGTVDQFVAWIARAGTAGPSRRPHQGPIPPRLWERRDRARADQDAAHPGIAPEGGGPPMTEGIVGRTGRDAGVLVGVHCLHPAPPA